MIRYLLIIVSPLLTHAQNNEKLNNLLDRAQKTDESYEVKNSVWNGQHPETFTYVNSEKLIEKAEKLKPILEGLINITEGLSEQDKINRQIRILQLKDEISEVEYKTYLLPINAEGGFYNSPAFFLPNLPFNKPEDYEAYIGWLPSFKNYINYNQKQLRKGIEHRIQIPKILVRNNIELLDPWIGKVSEHPFYQPFKNFPSTIPSSTQKVLNSKAREILSNTIIPAYKSLRSFLQMEYLPSAQEAIGISEIENGKEYYENRVRHFTTINLTPDSVFATGEAEVKRIRRLMEKIISDIGFEGNFRDFLKYLRTAPQFYPTSEQDLLNRAAWISKKAEGKLPALFSKLYSLPFTVAPVPEDIAPNYTGGRYVHGNRDQNRPGIYWVNIYKLDSRALYTLPALTLHEAVPGHHLQIALASEIKGLQKFRANYYISAFGEGWGLYSEFLGEEMGMYTTSYELFGRYTYEMWRACRLVVDVGIHYKGWTRKQAIAFMASNTALSIHEINTEIDRYIGWPGQAVSYKIGELMIKRLRKEAETALGKSFDIQQFHYEILKDGAVPLPILEAKIVKYIEKNKS